MRAAWVLMFLGIGVVAGCEEDDGNGPDADTGDVTADTADVTADEDTSAACTPACVAPGASCQNGACVCPPGYAGVACEVFDPCFDDPCVHGSCSADADAGTFVCTCEEGYRGATCDGFSAGIRVVLATLNLSEVGDVIFDLQVDDVAGAPLWQQRVSSSQYGDGKGSASFTGRCDPAEGTNTVKVWVVGVYADAVSPEAAGGFNAAVDTAGVTVVDAANPTWVDTNGDGVRDAGDALSAPLSRAFSCHEGQDTFVQFDIALMAPASQGFFDIAVNFAGVFCTAKFDCCTDDDGDDACAANGSEDIKLLFQGDGTRGPTVVLAFACVSDLPDAGTALYLDDLTLDCSDPDAASYAADITLRPVGPQGNHCTLGDDGMSTCASVTEANGVDADSVLFQLAVYPGAEVLSGGFGDPYTKLYWNIALGVKRPAIGACRLRTRATAVNPAGGSQVSLGTIPAGEIYTVISWDVPLGSCAQEPLTFDDPTAAVRVGYTAADAPATSFANGFSAAGDPSPFCAAPCQHGGQCLFAACACVDGYSGASCEIAP